MLHLSSGNKDISSKISFMWCWSVHALKHYILYFVKSKWFVWGLIISIYSLKMSNKYYDILFGSNSLSILQGQRTAAKAFCWYDSYSHLCWSFGPIRSYCWYHLIFPCRSVQSRLRRWTWTSFFLYVFVVCPDKIKIVFLLYFDLRAAFEHRLLHYSKFFLMEFFVVLLSLVYMMLLQNKAIVLVNTFINLCTYVVVMLE